MLMRFKDKSPGRCDDPNCPPPGQSERRHAFLFKLGDQSIMASDGHAEGKPEFKGFALSLAVKTEGEADKLFAALQRGRAR